MIDTSPADAFPVGCVVRVKLPKPTRIGASATGVVIGYGQTLKNPNALRVQRIGRSKSNTYPARWCQRVEAA